MSFHELAQVALLGTERKAPVIQSSNSGKGRLLSQLNLAEQERTLLSASALESSHARAGRLPTRDVAAPFPACVAEALPPASDHAGSLLGRMLDGEHPALLIQWLELAVKMGRIAPPELVPSLLEIGGKSQILQEPILKVVGERGRWLAKLNPDWAWVNGSAADDESVWQTGERPARLVFLKHLRSTNPQRALELLQAGWKQEPPEDRAAFVKVLETGLSTSDEPFLEAALDDKRSEFRRSAAKLLVRLPESGLVKRMTERVKPLLQFEAPAAAKLLKLKRAKAASIEVTLPSECSKDLQRDGVEAKQSGGWGEKAWWLIQMLEAVPLETWSKEWNATAAEIFKASLAGEWKKEFSEAWSRAAVAQQNAEWAGLLIGHLIETETYEGLESLLAVQPAAQLEEHLAAVLDRSNAKSISGHGRLIAQCRHEWNAAFSLKIISWIRQLPKYESYDWQLRNLLQEFAARVAIEALPELNKPWPTNARNWDFWSKGVDEMLSVAQFRSDVHTAFKTVS